MQGAIVMVVGGGARAGVKQGFGGGQQPPTAEWNGAKVKHC